MYFEISSWEMVLLSCIFTQLQLKFHAYLRRFFYLQANCFELWKYWVYMNADYISYISVPQRNQKPVIFLSSTTQIWK